MVAVYWSGICDVKDEKLMSQRSFVFNTLQSALVPPRCSLARTGARCDCMHPLALIMCLLKRIVRDGPIHLSCATYAKLTRLR